MDDTVSESKLEKFKKELSKNGMHVYSANIIKKDKKEEIIVENVLGLLIYKDDVEEKERIFIPLKALLNIKYPTQKIKSMIYEYMDNVIKGNSVKSKYPILTSDKTSEIYFDENTLVEEIYHFDNLKQAKEFAKKEKLNKIQYNVVYAKTTKKESGYFVELDTPIGKLYVRISDAINHSDWMAIKHITREGYEGYAENEVIIGANCRHIESHLKQNMIDPTTIIPICEEHGESNTKHYVRRLAKARFKPYQNYGYDINDL